MPTLDLQVGASSDDCLKYFQSGSPQFNLVASQDTAGYYNATYSKYGCGMRFLNVTIPQGATITAAYLTFNCQAVWSGTVVRTRVKGEAIDNAATFSTLADFDARTRTSASVDWDAIAAWAVDTNYNSIDIKTIIQEIVNRAGWASGNALVLFWDDFDDRSDHNANAIRAGKDYDISPTYAPKLHIEYSAVTAKTSSDAGAGVDAYVSLETPEAKSSSDIGSGLDGTPVPSAILAGSETGSSIDAIIARLLVSFDTGTDIEVAQLAGLLNDLFASELGEGCDLLTAKIEMPTKGGGMKLWT